MNDFSVSFEELQGLVRNHFWAMKIRQVSDPEVCGKVLRISGIIGNSPVGANDSIMLYAVSDVDKNVVFVTYEAIEDALLG